jgi:hypothetical protein
MMNINLESIDFDKSIQCRAVVSENTIKEYSEAMTEGATFPPVDLYGTEKECFIGDGWHRCLAAQDAGLLVIDANLHAGGKTLVCALGANSKHGERRTNADKKRSVKLAIEAFPDISNRAIARLCKVGHTIVNKISNMESDSSCEKSSMVVGGARNDTVNHEEIIGAILKKPTAGNVQIAADAGVSDKTVSKVRKEMLENEPPSLGAATGLDGKKRVRLTAKDKIPCRGMFLAVAATMRLDEITDDDSEISQALDHVSKYIETRKDNATRS